MDIQESIVTYITNLNAQAFQQQLIGTLAAVTLLLGGMIYMFYMSTATQIQRAHSIIKLATKAEKIVADNRGITQEEERIADILEKNRDFNIKSFFEQFTREHNVTPEPNWATTTNPIEGNEKFEEVMLPATFKHQTTKTLVTLLDALDKKEIVYLKEINIVKEGQTIRFDLILATKKSRRVIT